MAIEDALTLPDEAEYTPRRPVLRGNFNINKAAIPYYQALMSLEEIESELKLVESLPSDLRQKWRLEELFQREIDWERVKTEIVNGYLRRPEKLQFFNALTVALLPLNDRRMLDSTYGAEGAPPPLPEVLSRAPWEAKNIGGVQIVAAPKHSMGWITWDKRRIFAATIDGQHRLAALQDLVRTGNLPSSTLSTTVPVTFLLLDAGAGLSVPDTQFADDANKILGIVREIFIDLNKSARPVVRARRILLDDQEIEARCVRDLLSPRIGEVSEDKLPLGLVHWQHNVTAKFNAGKGTGPFITTVELLYSIMKDVLDLRMPKDPLEEADVRKFVQSVENTLHVSDLVLENPDRYQRVPRLINYVEQNNLKEGFEQPFSNLPGPYLRACDDGFRRYWRSLFIGVLRRFKPYSDFIEQVRAKGGLDGDLAFYLALPERAQVQQMNEWGEARREKVEQPLEYLASLKTKDWPFYAVFQKGLLRATATAWRHFRPGASGSSEMTEFLERWIAFLDLIFATGLLEVRATLDVGSTSLLWAGIAVNPGAKTVKWNESTVERIHCLLLLWWYIHSNALRHAKRFMKAVDKPKNSERYPRGKDAVRELKKSLRSVVVGAEEEEVPDDVVDSRTSDRVAAVLDRVCRLTPEASATDVLEDETAEEAGVPPGGGDDGAQ